MEQRQVLPGEELAVVEEYEAGEGTYEENGRVYAAQSGVLALDAEHRVARVTPFNPPAHLAVGDVVYGTVTEIRSSMAEARIASVHGRSREVAGELDASLHVSRIANAYVEDIRDAMRLGDIVRMRVIQADPSLQVTTAEQNLGVVIALCTFDRAPMERRGGDQVRCPRCERTSRRKLAADYGDLELTAPIVRAPEPEAPRRESRPEGDWGDRRGGPRGGRGGDRGRGRGPPRERREGGGRGRGGGRGGRPPSRRDRRR